MRRSAGYTYMTILFLVAIMSAGLGFVGEMWATTAQREREAELLYVGNQYRKAIERYYQNGPRQFPRELAHLLQDSRKPNTERYLRRLYPDPLTGNPEWGLIKAPDGGIMGVHSLSNETPLKTDNFKLRDKEFMGAAKYSDWKFVFTSVASPTTVLPRTQ